MNPMTFENDQRYLVSSQWWQQWCDYANFDLNQVTNVEQTAVRNANLIKRGMLKSKVQDKPTFDNEEIINTARQREKDFKRELLSLKSQKSQNNYRESRWDQVDNKSENIDSLDNGSVERQAQDNDMQKIEEYKRPKVIRN